MHSEVEGLSVHRALNNARAGWGLPVVEMQVGGWDYSDISAVLKRTCCVLTRSASGQWIRRSSTQRLLEVVGSVPCRRRLGHQCHQRRALPPAGDLPIPAAVGRHGHALVQTLTLHLLIWVGQLIYNLIAPQAARPGTKVQSFLNLF